MSPASRDRRPPIARCSLSSGSTASRVRSLSSPLRALDPVCARRAWATAGDGRTGGLRAPGGSSDCARRYPPQSRTDTIRLADRCAASALQDRPESSVVRRPDVQLLGDCACPPGSGAVGQPTLLRPRERLQHPTEIGAHLAQSPQRLAKSANRRMTSWRLLDFPAPRVPRVLTPFRSATRYGYHRPGMPRASPRNVNLTTGRLALDPTGRLIEEDRSEGPEVSYLSRRERRSGRRSVGIFLAG